jgi:hypothetical protein
MDAYIKEENEAVEFLESRDVETRSKGRATLSN